MTVTEIEGDAVVFFLPNKNPRFMQVVDQARVNRVGTRARAEVHFHTHTRVEK
ncbi:MAG: hypothetical protein KJN92_17090 [Gemmatimonadetes bacterium]|nr:hypothetical protein [Gemmatimonadota bacterium]